MAREEIGDAVEVLEVQRCVCEGARVDAAAARALGGGIFAISVPRGPSFNPKTPSGVDWIAAMPLLAAENITYNDQLYRQRLRSPQVVDE